MPAMIEFPSWIKPEIIPGLPFRWYGLMYVFAFGTTWLLFRRESRRLDKPWTEGWPPILSMGDYRVRWEEGGRHPYLRTDDYYWRRPGYSLALRPNRRFVGSGHVVSRVSSPRSSHPGMGQGRRQRWLEWADLIALSVPLGIPSAGWATS